MPPAKLTPFVSITLMSPPGEKTATEAIAHVAAKAAAMIPKSDLAHGSWKSLSLSPEPGANIKGYTYQRHVQVTWTDEALKDLQNHLLLILAGHGFLAVHATDPKLQDNLTAALRSTREGSPLAGYAPIPRENLEAAFVRDGQAKSLWLKGMHARSALKADSKILSGDDLAYALDVFDDQTFWWSAARARNPKLGAVVGASAKASRIWVRKAADAMDFQQETLRLAAHLKKAKPGGQMRVLASPETSVDMKQLTSAYDLSLMPPDFGVDLAREGVTHEELAEDASTASFLVKGSRGSADFELELRLNGTTAATAKVAVTLGRGAGQVRFKVTPDVTPADAALPAQAKRILETVRLGDDVNVHYDSGYSVSGRRAFKTVFRRVAFERYAPRTFDPLEVNIEVEKPSSPDQIGNEKSLFCWLQKQLTGHLMCDDGSMEKADFIHIEQTTPPTLTFYHIKGSHSANKKREISVAAYEVVTAQAIKNLIWLDKNDFLKGLKRRIRPDHQYWKNAGETSNADEFAAAVKGLAAGWKRKVVVLQPSLSEATRNEQLGKSTAQGRRLDQLEFLLAAAEQTCRSLSARFEVICAE